MPPEDARADRDRAAALVAALDGVRARIAGACAASGREPQAVTLVAVTKTHPAGDVARLARLGVLDIGESRDQEARAKIAELSRDAALSVDLRWHLVGRLQTNKAASVVSYADAVHSVDRVKLANTLADAAERGARPGPLDVFVQVSLDGDPARGGVGRTEVGPLAEAIALRPTLRLRGVMAVAPRTAQPDAAFARLAEISAGLRIDHPDARDISAGMSGDLEAAVRHGATYVRVGSALLGRRV